LKVTITWIDIPYDSSQIGNKNLINDLDLIVLKQNPIPTTFYGNKVAGGDHVNPAEQVILPADDEGTYIIYIKAHTLVSDQNVSIAITYPNGTIIDGPYKAEPATVTTVTTPAPTAAPGPAPLPLNGQNFSIPSFTYPLNVNVPCNSPVDLEPFSAFGDIRMVKLHITNQPASKAYMLSAIITAPNGFVAQIGQNLNWVYSPSNLYLKSWQSGVTYSVRGNSFFITHHSSLLL
jgi:hypothetical protein